MKRNEIHICDTIDEVSDRLCDRLAIAACVFCGKDVCKGHARELVVGVSASNVAESGAVESHTISVAEMPDRRLCSGCASELQICTSRALEGEWETIVECIKATMAEASLAPDESPTDVDEDGNPIPAGPLPAARALPLNTAGKGPMPTWDEQTYKTKTKWEELKKQAYEAKYGGK